MNKIDMFLFGIIGLSGFLLSELYNMNKNLDNLRAQLENDIEEAKKECGFINKSMFKQDGSSSHMLFSVRVRAGNPDITFF